MVIDQRKTNGDHKTYHNTHQLFGNKIRILIGSTAYYQDADHIQGDHIGHKTKVIISKVVIKKHISIAPCWTWTVSVYPHGVQAGDGSDHLKNCLHPW